MLVIPFPKIDLGLGLMSLQGEGGSTYPRLANLSVADMQSLSVIDDSLAR